MPRSDPAASGGKADYEIAAATSELIEAAALASRPTGEVVPTTYGGRLSLSERVPVGLVGVITPWNFPLVLGMRVIAPALALGNAVLIKPSPETPLSGGLIVTEGIARAYTDGLAKRASAITVGNTVTEDVGLGPMINQRQLGRAAKLLADAVAEGARVVAGGTTKAPFFLPTVVTGVSTGSALWTEEIFAPIAPIVVVKDADEAVALANDTGYGLVSSVVTGDLFRGGQLARQLRWGMAHVNDATPQDEASAPFGGIGQSGLGGRAGGDANLEEFTERRWLTLNPGPLHYPY
ncbi:MAG TPA: aldehyde dehydrogenase family protein [Trebonia sp.]